MFTKGKSKNKLNINKTNTRISHTKCLVAQINKKAELDQKHTLNKNSRSDRKSFAKHKHTQTSEGEGKKNAKLYESMCSLKE